MAYNDNETQLFIRLYKERPVLWNTQDASYTRKEARVQAVREIADMMGRTGELIILLIMGFSNS